MTGVPACVILHRQGWGTPTQRTPRTGTSTTHMIQARVLLVAAVGLAAAARVRRVARRRLLADTAQDLSRRAALRFCAEDLRPVGDEVTRRPRRLLPLWRLASRGRRPIVEQIDDGRSACLRASEAERGHRPTDRVESPAPAKGWLAEMKRTSSRLPPSAPRSRLSVAWMSCVPPVYSKLCGVLQ